MTPADWQQQLDALEESWTMWEQNHRTQQIATRELFVKHRRLPPMTTVDPKAYANLDWMFSQLKTARVTLTRAYSTTSVSKYERTQAKADFLQKRGTMQSGMRMYPDAGAFVVKVQNSGMLKEPLPLQQRRPTTAQRVASADNEMQKVAASLAAAKTHRTYTKLQLLNPHQPGPISNQNT
jgi:hypothetical protein